MIYVLLLIPFKTFKIRDTLISKTTLTVVKFETNLQFVIKVKSHHIHQLCK